MARIAVGGWQHETNTFAIKKAEYQDFERADEWPPLSTGEEMFAATQGVHLPVTGAIEALKSRGHELVPLLWCSATPCSYVTEFAFEKICKQFLELVKQALPLDGIYLDLHGAMVCEHLEDGEGEFLRRLRQVVGDEIPVAVSLDLHANVTPEMVKHATIIDIFRTYPHIDMGATGARVSTLLDEILRNGFQLFSSFRQPEFMIALNFGCTLIEPCQGLYKALPELITNEVKALSFACGFHLSDIYEVGPAVVSYATSQNAADVAAEKLISSITKNREGFGQKIWAQSEGVSEAIRRAQPGHATIVLADTQDNPGGGGSGDTTGLLQELIAQRASNALFGALSDPEVVEQAVQIGIGKKFKTSLGGKSGMPDQSPFHCECEVKGLFDGNFVATGPMYKGASMTLGPCALLEIEGVLVALSSYPVQTADQAIFRHFGIEPSSMAIIGLKSSVHFRNDFTELASDILVVASPGAVYADPSALDYKRKRPSIQFR
ncbi:MAG: M81 family metallopeptidase [Acidiferrobacterales bacterium]|nr:M81 family metallopeptidase [Acidiferrobacterales bacterium]